MAAKRPASFVEWLNRYIGFPVQRFSASTL